MDSQTRINQGARQVLNEHAQLRELLKEIAGNLDKPRPEVGEVGSHRWAAKLAQKLTKLHHKLYLHFRHEERSGIFEEIKSQHPWAESKVDEMKREHPAILRELLALIQAFLRYSQGEEPNDPRLRKRLEKVLLRLTYHEERETDLIQCLHGLDLGDSGVG